MWRPHPGPQTEFLERSEFEVLFGGAAGPGKTDCLIMEALRYIKYPDYKGVIFRRTFPQLGEIIDRCFMHYPGLGGTYRSTEHRWYFPTGASVILSQMQHENDKYNHTGKEYQFIGFDELTQFTETQYTYLHSRSRSTNPNMQSYIRATTNPGGLGHNWVKDRFVTITEPRRTYIDPKTGLTRAFIPATVQDNPTLFENDPGYLARLESLPEIEKQRLRYGIWDAFEGQVFTELSQRVHGIDPFDIPPEWERVCVLDWGFAKPFSVGWYAIDYDGILYRYREWYGCKEGEQDIGLKMPAYEVARGIVQREGSERVKMRIADPSIWHPRPDSRRGESRGATIQEDMANEGVFFLRADNDRLQGKMQVHKRLRIETEADKETGEIITEHPMFYCFKDHKHFWRTMESLQENPRDVEDVDTKQEDHCFHKDTLVITDEGPHTIGELVNTSGKVLGINGWTDYYDCRLTRRNAETVRVMFEDLEIQCTPDHEFLTTNGWVQAKELKGKQCRLSSVTQSKNLTELDITNAENISAGKANYFIGWYGSIITDLLRKGFISTMWTRILRTMSLRIWNYLMLTPINLYMGRLAIEVNGYPLCAKVPRDGMEARKEGHGIRSIMKEIAGPRWKRKRNLNARFAIKNTSQQERDIALTIANRNGEGCKALTILQRIAKYAVNSLSSTNTPGEPHAQGSAVLYCQDVVEGERSDVYCLTTDTHYFAIEKGLIVSNCYDEFRYMCMNRPIVPKRIEKAPVGSFQYERNKMIKAKQYAKRNGCSVATAYQRMR